jgi:2,4-dienoyl-CoA reductase (NADPH2)
MAVPPGAYAYLALGIKKKISAPVFPANRIIDPGQAEKILREGWADAVCIGRGQIADPDWANKAKEGRADEIRPCVGCMQGCMDRLFSMKPVECLANPCTGWEGERKIIPAQEKKRVLVIGGGAAGCEAAITAKLRGLEVELWEASDRIGGQLYVAAAPPGREDFGRLAQFYAKEVVRVGVKVRLRKKATVAKIAKAGFQQIILATGAKPIKINLPGANLDFVHQAWDVLKEGVKLGEKVVVIGGGSTGIETAIYAGRQGTINAETLKFLFMYNAEKVEKLAELCSKGAHSVVILEMLDKLGPDLGVATKWVLLAELQQLGVKSITKAKVVKIAKGEVIYETDGKTLSEPADSVILALGSQADTKLEQELDKAGIKFLKAGDANKPRKIMDAVHEGFLAATQL